MNQYDALKVLGLFGQVSPEIIKQAYKKACSKYHPDRNPAGLEIMKMVNIAYEVLKAYDGKATVNEASAQYGEEVAQALNQISHLGLTIEICGAWVWVSGDTKSHKEVLKKLVLNGQSKNFAGISDLLMLSVVALMGNILWTLFVKSMEACILRQKAKSSLHIKNQSTRKGGYLQ